MRMTGLGFCAPQVQSLVVSFRGGLDCLGTLSSVEACLLFMGRLQLQEASYSMAKAPSQQEFTSLKQQYDQLLDKNQNDLITIKQREKAMKDQIETLKTNNQQAEQLFQKQIQQLQADLKKQKERPLQPEGTLTVSLDPSKKVIENLEIDTRRLMDQNITLTSENTLLTLNHQEEVRKNQGFVQEKQNLQNFIESLERDIKQMKAVQQHAQKQTNDVSINTLQQMVSQELLTSREDELTKKSELHRATKEKYRAVNQQLKELKTESKMLAQSEQRCMKLIKRKDGELAQMEGQLNKLKLSVKPKKRTQSLEGACTQCGDLKQQISLLKQMVKSTQGMIRVKEIQNSKYRMHSGHSGHSGEDTILNHSKSSTRSQEKGTPLPPLRKK